MPRPKGRRRRNGWRRGRQNQGRQNQGRRRSSQNPRGREKKFLDKTFLSNTIPPFIPIEGLIIADTVCDVEQGVGQKQRIGRKITLTGIGLKWLLTMPPSVPDDLQADQITFYVYLDKQANGTAALPGQILADLVPPALGAVNILSYRQLTQIDRFRILFTWTGKMHSTANAATYNGDSLLDEVWLPVNIPVQYSGADGFLAQITSNNVGILILSATESTQAVFSSRIRYTDM